MTERCVIEHHSPRRFAKFLGGLHTHQSRFLSRIHSRIAYILDDDTVPANTGQYRSRPDVVLTHVLLKPTRNPFQLLRAGDMRLIPGDGLFHLDLASSQFG